MKLNKKNISKNKNFILKPNCCLMRLTLCSFREKYCTTFENCFDRNICHHQLQQQIQGCVIIVGVISQFFRILVVTTKIILVLKHAVRPYTVTSFELKLEICGTMFDDQLLHSVFPALIIYLSLIIVLFSTCASADSPASVLDTSSASVINWLYSVCKSCSFFWRVFFWCFKAFSLFSASHTCWSSLVIAA